MVQSILKCDCPDTVPVFIDKRFDLGKSSPLLTISNMRLFRIWHFTSIRSLRTSPQTNAATWRNIFSQSGLLSEGLSGGVEAGVRCFFFHEAKFRALSEGLDIPNDFAIWANNLSKVCTVPPGDTCTA
jgi:hypothetical protein